MNSRKLFVGNLTYTVRAGDLKELFSRFGDVISVNVLEKKGYGFIEMKTPEEAEKARNALSETEFEGRNLLIDGVRPMMKKKKSHAGSDKGRPGTRTQVRSDKRPASAAGGGYRGKKPHKPSGHGAGSGTGRGGTGRGGAGKPAGNRPPSSRPSGGGRPPARNPHRPGRR